MGILDTRHINKELEDFGDTVTVRKVTKLDYDKRGNAQVVLGDSKNSESTSGDDSNTACYDSNYVAQTFTIGSSGITLTSIKIKVKRTGTPGAITIGVYAVDGDSKPTGSALDEETLDYTDLIDDGDTEWITLPVTYDLSSETMYSLVVSVSGGDTDNKYDVRTVSAGGYDDGNILTSDDGGSSWTASSEDIVFELFGDTSTIAMVDVLTQNDDEVTSGLFKSGDKRFTFKNNESNIVRGTKLYHDSKWYQIDELFDSSLQDTDYWLQVVARKI